MGDTGRWTDLLDPSPDELRANLPADLHPTALALLVAQPVADDQPRSRIESHDTYVVGVLLIAVVVPD